MKLKHCTATLLLALSAVALSLALTAVALAASSTGGAGVPAPAAASAPASPAAKVRPSGVATWFGPGFYGKKTACGQTLTPGVIGVANRTLPCGTLVRVTYSTHTLTVPVLDRGPYSHADWDLTAGAAEALGVTETVRIHTRVIGRVANTPELGAPPVSSTGALAGGALAG